MILATVGPWEIAAVVLIVVLVFGASQLPKLARSVGQAQKELKKGMKEGLQDDEADEEETSS